MKNIVLGVIFSFFITAGSVAAVSSGSNLPDEKKKKCKTEKKECKAEGKSKKSCCSSKKDDGSKKTQATPDAQ